MGGRRLIFECFLPSIHMWRGSCGSSNRAEIIDPGTCNTVLGYSILYLPGRLMSVYINSEKKNEVYPQWRN